MATNFSRKSAVSVASESAALLLAGSWPYSKWKSFDVCSMKK